MEISRRFVPSAGLIKLTPAADKKYSIMGGGESTFPEIKVEIT
jgi:hypothetical protein